jgi:hypothetical protein
MSRAERSSIHDETWLVLPWLANGRLSHAERERAEEHVRECSECANELAAQQRLCDALSAPERVTYAPGPSFRKLLERIDGPGAQIPRTEAGSPRTEPPRIESLSPRRRKSASAALWRPPGLAWAASFVLMVAVTGLVATTYRWSEPRYFTRSDPAEARRPEVLHIALDRELTIGEVSELLRVDGARVVEGPGTTGIFGVTPVTLGPSQRGTDRQLLDLATRLRADPRVRWVEPIAMDPTRLPEKSTPRGP